MGDFHKKELHVSELIILSTQTLTKETLQNPTNRFLNKQADTIWSLLLPIGAWLAVIVDKCKAFSVSRVCSVVKRVLWDVSARRRLYDSFWLAKKALVSPQVGLVHSGQRRVSWREHGSLDFRWDWTRSARAWTQRTKEGTVSTGFVPMLGYVRLILCSIAVWCPWEKHKVVNLQVKLAC